MQPARLPERARRQAGLTRAELARRAAASFPASAAYAAGRKCPNLATAERIIQAAGSDLELVPLPVFREPAVGRGRAVYVPEVLPRLAADRALGRVRLPLRLNWSPLGRA
jgi:DNA-binding XRE family transcriptional regulator